jgi:Rrf2 family protein
MKLTRASDYAIHALVAMASQKETKIPVASHLTARDQGIPERFLLKVLKPLVAAGMLQSIKGPHGGYQLAKPASKITLLDVIEAVDGPIRGLAPLAQGKGAQKLDNQLEEICQQIAEAMRRQLAKVRLSELIGKGENGKK